MEGKQRSEAYHAAYPFVITLAPSRSPALSAAGRPIPRRVQPPGHLPATKNTRPASDPASTTPRGRAYHPRRRQIGVKQMRERGMWKENIQRYLYTKHPKHPWPILGKVCVWQGSCDSISMYTYKPTTLHFRQDYPGHPRLPHWKSTVPPGKIQDNPTGMKLTDGIRMHMWFRFLWLRGVTWHA